jgi:hypothetical protein
MITGCGNPVIITARACLAPLRPTGAGPKRRQDSPPGSPFPPFCRRSAGTRPAAVSKPLHSALRKADKLRGSRPGGRPVPKSQHTPDTVRPPQLRRTPDSCRQLGPFGLPPSIRAGADPAATAGLRQRRRIVVGSRHAAATGHPSNRSGHADRSGRPARVRRSGRRPMAQRRLKGGRDRSCPRPAVLVRAGGDRCRSYRTPQRTQLRTRQPTISPHLGQLRLCSQAADGQSADRSGSLQVPLRFLQGWRAA